MAEGPLQRATKFNSTLFSKLWTHHQDQTLFQDEIPHVFKTYSPVIHRCTFIDNVGRHRTTLSIASIFIVIQNSSVILLTYKYVLQELASSSIFVSIAQLL